MTVQLGSLYTASVIVDIILMVYMFLLYKKFHSTIKHLEFFVYHRALIIVSYLLVFLRAVLTYQGTVLIGNSLFIISSAVFLHVIRELAALEKDQKLEIALVALFIPLYAFFMLVIPSYMTRMVIFSFVTIIQYGTFVYDYFNSKKTASRPYLSTAVVLILFLLSHLLRILNSLFTSHSDLNPLTGTILDGLLLILLIVANICISLTLNITFHKLSAQTNE